MLSASAIPFLYLSAALFAPHAANAAVVSLFIPDAQPSEVTAEFLGTDSAGHTTWAIGNGQPSDTITAAPIATMVAGPTDLHLVEDVSALGGILHDDCGIKDGVAVCTIVLSSSASVRTVGIKTESASAFAVPVGATAPPAAPSASGTGAQLRDRVRVRARVWPRHLGALLRRVEAKGRRRRLRTGRGTVLSPA
ncbi:hypothetical protein C8T65DRAFT_47576 [Cerioporus squamosus]|nr:hypothetical protein C8T65DRAFT_47576 [Cerioporus squamosus]